MKDLTYQEFQEYFLAIQNFHFKQLIKDILQIIISTEIVKQHNILLHMKAVIKHISEVMLSHKQDTCKEEFKKHLIM